MQEALADVFQRTDVLVIPFAVTFGNSGFVLLLLDSRNANLGTPWVHTALTAGVTPEYLYESPRARELVGEAIVKVDDRLRNLHERLSCSDPRRARAAPSVVSRGIIRRQGARGKRRAITLYSRVDPLRGRSSVAFRSLRRGQAGNLGHLRARAVWAGARPGDTSVC